jgi:hypothetical protein
MTASRHLHKYKKINLARNQGTGKREYYVYKCLKPACSHYIRVDLAEGKLCECNRCGQPMIIGKSTLLLTLVHCNECTKKKKDITPAKEAIEQFLSGNKTEINSHDSD